MVIKAKREEDESWALFYSSVLLILLSQCLLGAGVGLFPCFPQPLILLLLLLHFHVSTVHVNSRDMEVQKKKKKRAPLVTGRRRKSVRLWLLCCSCYCTVQWTVQLACTVRKKQHFAAFSSPAYQTLKCVGPMYSKVCISFYQTAANCVLIKTQPQPRSQTGSKSAQAQQISSEIAISVRV